MVNDEAILSALVGNEILPEKVDAIVCLEGDEDFIRADKALELFEEKLSSVIMVLGPKKIEDYLLEKGLKKDGIVRVEWPEEKNKRNTHTEAENVMKKVVQENWKSIALTTSFFHQPRAYLTFLKVSKDLGLLGKIKIFNAPVKHHWYEKFEGFSRLELLSSEFEKITEYQKKGHLATIKEALKHQQWKEQQ